MAILTRDLALSLERQTRFDGAEEKLNQAIELMVANVSPTDHALLGAQEAYTRFLRGGAHHSIGH